MRRGDAVRLTATDSDMATGTLGVVVEAYPISDPTVVLVEFEAGKRLLPLTCIEEVTAVGATTGPTKRGRRRVVQSSQSPADPG